MRNSGEKKRMINYVIDVILLLAIILLIITGFIKYPPIQRLLSIHPTDMPYTEISAIHDISGFAMLFFGIIHIILHLGWLKKTTKSIVKRGPQIILVALGLIFIGTAIFSIVYLTRSTDEVALEDFQHKEKTLRIESIGDFSFDTAEITTMRNDLFSNAEFSVFDIAIYLNSKNVINMEYHFNTTIDSYVIDSVNGIEGWWYQVHGAQEEINKGIFIDRFAYDDQYTYELVSIEENELRKIYGEQDENTNAGIENQLVTLAEDTIRQLVEGELTDETIEELSAAGFKRELVDLLKAASQSSYPAYKDGVFIGIADAHNGDITVEVTIYEGRILYIEVIDHKETAPYLEEVFRSIPFNILKNQTTDSVDTVSGATESSKGLLSAIDDALSKARK